MDKTKRKELIEEYKQIKTYMGAIRIVNQTNGKVFVDTYPNLKNKWSTIQAQLNMGRFANLQLQKDWTTLGPDAFTFEVLEQKEADEITDMRWELKLLKKRWLEELQPYGEKGYNRVVV